MVVPVIVITPEQDQMVLDGLAGIVAREARVLHGIARRLEEMGEAPGKVRATQELAVRCAALAETLGA